jgi:Tfp pilus assembly protein PilX
MNSLSPKHTRQGSIIVITLVLLLVMTSMAVGLYYSTLHTAKQVAISGNRSEALYSSESCIVEAIDWLEIEVAKGTPPCKGSSGACPTITANMNNSKWRLSGESVNQQNRIGAQSYQCEIFPLASIVSAGSGVGFDIGGSDIYSGSSARTKYLYKIRSKTNGANSVTSQVEVIVSTIF